MPYTKSTETPCHDCEPTLSKISMKHGSVYGKTDPYLAWSKKVTGTGTDDFKNIIEKKFQLKFNSYWDLHKWSIQNCETFWSEVWNYFKVISSKNYNKVFTKTGPGFLDCKWFTGATFNYAENILRHRDDRVAISNMLSSQDNQCIEVTYAELYEKVRLYAAAFRNNGLKKGDVVCYMIDNRTETIVAYLAAASIGAISGGIQVCYGLKGAAAIAQRMAPKFFIAVDSIQKGGSRSDNLEKISFIAKNTPSIEKIVILPSLPETFSSDISHISNSCFLGDFLESGKCLDGSIPELIFEQVSFDHPLHLVFTSGTTGLPKAPVHGHGTFLPILLDIAFHLNLKPGDTIFTVVGMGWGIWNAVLPALAHGVKLSCYNDDILYVKDGRSFWDTVAKDQCTLLFLDPVSLDVMDKMNIVPAKDVTLEHLKFITLVGSPMLEQNAVFVQEKVKKDVFVGSLYGCTETKGFLSGFDVNLPLYSGEIQVSALGKEIKCFDKEGNSVTGELGEFVQTTQSPSYPLRLWKDDDNSVLNQEYLDRFPGVWCTKDEGYINPKTKGIVIIGRSDNVLVQNSGTCGPADIYTAIHDMEEISDYICVGQEGSKGNVRTVLFVKLNSAYDFIPELVKKIELQIEKELWIDLVPEVILPVPDIPYSVNGKRMEIAVKKIVKNNQIQDFPSIRNPECLHYFCNRQELMNY